MANVPITSLPVAVAIDGTPYLEVAQNVAGVGLPAVYVSKRVQAQQIANQFANELPAAIEYVVDDGGLAITAGNKGYLKVPFAGVFTVVSLLGNTTGSVEIDIWKCTYAQFDGGITYPTAADSIVGGNYPTITAGTKYQDTTLALWTTTFAANDVLAFVVNSNSGFTRLTIAMNASRTVT